MAKNRQANPRISGSVLDGCWLPYATEHSRMTEDKQVRLPSDLQTSAGITACDIHRRDLAAWTETAGAKLAGHLADPIASDNKRTPSLSCRRTPRAISRDVPASSCCGCPCHWQPTATGKPCNDVGHGGSIRRSSRQQLSAARQQTTARSQTGSGVKHQSMATRISRESRAVANGRERTEERDEFNRTTTGSRRSAYLQSSDDADDGDIYAESRESMQQRLVSAMNDR